MAVTLRAVRVGSLLFTSLRESSSYTHSRSSVRSRTYCRAGSEPAAPQSASLASEPVPSQLTNERIKSASACARPDNSARDASPRLGAEPGRSGSGHGSAPGNHVAGWDAPTIQVVFENEDVVAVNKPPGIMVHASREAPREERTRRFFVKDMVEQQLGLDRPLFPAHRIDRPASGVLVFGRTADACTGLREAMAHPLAVKEYIVLVRGSPPNAFTSDKPLKDDKGAVKPASSEFRKLLEIPQHRCALLSARITTGRRHQIRRHLNHFAFQVIGDSVHGKGRTNAYFRENHRLPPARLFLHAARLLLPLRALQVGQGGRPGLGRMHLGAAALQAESPAWLAPEAPASHLPLASEAESPSIHTFEGGSTSRDGRGKDEGFLEVVAPLPNDLVNVLLSLDLDLATIMNLHLLKLTPNIPS
ncbi:hypothetical protein CLOM_g14265 [Closterium sp. NIES-68]|nr:hypothetical protein CLOM_g12909 [Closterium sp. NIES-68]GJP55288.1 hypothetical protein CLOM_g14265 [Closterium sp. NIES-68]GJP83165.1 hypothetical protein CLOP_g13359 [Closterium sp. NIES-67]